MGFMAPEFSGTRRPGSRAVNRSLPVTLGALCFPFSKDNFSTKCQVHVADRPIFLSMLKHSGGLFLRADPSAEGLTRGTGGFDSSTV